MKWLDSAIGTRDIGLVEIINKFLSFIGETFCLLVYVVASHIHQQTECSWGGFLIVVKSNIISGLFVGCCACVIVYAVWDFVHNSHCGIMSCGILACGIYIALRRDIANDCWDLNKI